jgi:hypothetical protein
LESCGRITVFLCEYHSNVLYLRFSFKIEIAMQKLILAALCLFLFTPNTKAQFGFKTKAEIEAFKDSRLIVVLFEDSAYNASIKAAVQQYWNFTGSFEFIQDTSLKAYNKPEYTFLTFARSKKSKKIKAKLCSTEDDFNGLVVSTKFKKRSKLDEVIAEAYCGNAIDTADWYPEMVRGVQILNNYFNFAIQAENDRDISPTTMTHNYPADLTTISGKRLIYEDQMLALKGKEDATELFGNEVVEVGRKDIYNAILSQDPDVIYVYSVFNETYCDKIFVSAANNEVVYFISGRVDECKLEARDLRSFRSKIEKANK